MSHDGPIVIAYDGSPAAERAIRDTGPLLGGRRTLVVVIWKAGLGFELVELPTSSVGLPPVAVDVRTALEIDAELSERAQRTAQRGAVLAREAGFEASGLTVADDPEADVGDAIVRVADERDAQAVVLGEHVHRGLGERPGRIVRRVIVRASCPVVVARDRDREGDGSGDD
jgi:nucleotide-binding universal stress UspA family protein